MTNTPEPYQDDEINLRELVATLWKSKLLILAITALFSIAGITYALLAAQEWRAKAIVAEPSPTEVEQLRLRLDYINKFAGMTNSSENDVLASIMYKNDTYFLDAFAEKKLFAEFIQSFDAYDNKHAFLKTMSYVPQEDGQDETSLRKALEKWGKGIGATQKKNETFFTLSFVADNGQQARQRLIEYINFIQAKEETLKNKLLTEQMANQHKALTLSYQILTADTLKRLQEDISRTEFAVRISKTAGIEAPVENLNNQNLFAIDLGAKALGEKLKILKEIKYPELINPKLADIRLQLDSLEALPQEKINFSSFKFLQTPTEPLNRAKPKRSLVVALATLAGLMLGMVVALFRGRLFLSDN